MEKEKQGKLDKLLSESTKKYGDVVLDRNKLIPCNVISTGSLEIDIAIGRGGLPKGRLTEVYGMESSGKTTLALQVLAEAQKNGGLTAFIDAEHALDPIYATNLGVDLDKVVISQPDTGEQLMDLTYDFLSSGLFDAIVVDSVSGIVPRACLEGASEDQHMALLARLMSAQIPRMAKRAATTDTALIYLNQMRGTMGATKFAPQSAPTGGNTLKFWASVRIQCARTGTNKDGDGDAVSNEVDIAIKKNKLAAPFKVAKTRIVFGEGFDLNYEITNKAIELKMIDKSGSWYTMPDGERLQGINAVSDYFNANAEVKDGLHRKIREMYNIP